MDPHHNEEENPINLGDDDDFGNEEMFDYDTFMRSMEANSEEINHIRHMGVTFIKNESGRKIKAMDQYYYKAYYKY